MKYEMMVYEVDHKAEGRTQTELKWKVDFDLTDYYLLELQNQNLKFIKVKGKIKVKKRMEGKK